MDVTAGLLEIAEFMLVEKDEWRTADVVLRRVLEATGAERGFLVAGHGDAFEQRAQVRFDRNEISKQERNFSRSLVRRVIQSREMLYSPNLPEDARFAGLESVRALERCCVLVAPLSHADEVYGAVYLEHRELLDCFDPRAQQFLAGFAKLAGGFLRQVLERDALRERARNLERDLFAQYDFTGIVTQDAKML